MTDNEYMEMAIEEAKKGIGFTNPNPIVGALVVKDGRIIGKGYHQRCGELHAERNAINSCKESPQGGTIYVTLEPCCHYGKTPPCTLAIIESGIKKVVVGSYDPNPLVDKKGIKILRENGVEVVEQVLKEECDKLNEVFFFYIKNKKPFICMKYAMTMDGKIASKTGESKWITCEKSREYVHKLRHKYMAIMVGVNTVIIDNPMLNTRIDGLKNPIRIICDSSLKTPHNSQIVQTAKDICTIIATANKDINLHKTYEEYGVKIITVSKNKEHINLVELMNVLGDMGIDSILVEGGATLNYSLISQQLVNKIITFISPKIFGGEDAKSPVTGIGISRPCDAFIYKNKEIQVIDEDIMIEWEVK